MNLKNKTLSFLLLFFINISYIFSFDANLQIDKKETDINDYIKLRVVINSDKWWEIWITKIKWLDNFEIINQSQSQSSSSSIVIVDGKTERKTQTSHNLDLVLKAKEKWDYILWPAYLKNWKEEIKTNDVKISVTWDNLFINNNHLQVPKQKNTNNNQVLSSTKNENNDIDKKIDDYSSIEKKEFWEGNFLYLFLWVLLSLIIWFYLILKNSFWSNKLKSNELFVKNEKDNINDNVKKINIEVIYPDINDSNFISKINNIFKQKIWKKYGIQNIENKTNEELLNVVSNDVREEIQNLTHMLNKAKYSNIEWDNEKILELIKNI